MYCQKYGSNNVTVQVVTETKLKKEKARSCLMAVHWLVVVAHLVDVLYFASINCFDI